MTREKRIAFHEAGHAVAGVRFQFNPRASIIRNKPERSLDLDYDKPNGRLDAERAGKAIIALLSGYAAQRQCGLISRQQAALDSGDDFLDVTHIISRLGPLKRLGPLNMRSFSIWQAQANNFVEDAKNRRAIDMVVRDLLERRRLGCDELDWIVAIADGVAGAERTLANLRYTFGLPFTRQFPGERFGYKILR